MSVDVVRSPGTVTAVARHPVHAFSKPTGDEIVLVAGLGVEGDAHAGVTVRHRSRVAADPAQPNLRQVHLIHQELLDEVAAEGFAVAPGELGENVTTSGVDLLGLPCGAVLRFGPPPGRAGGDRAAPAAAGARHGAGPVTGGAAEAVTDGAAEAVTDGAAEAVAGVIAAAGRATLDGPTTGAVAALVAAVHRDATRPDPRPAVVIAGLRNPCRQIDGFRDGLLKQVVYRNSDGRLVRRAGVMGVVLRGGPVRPGDPVTVDVPPAPHAPLDRV